MTELPESVPERYLLVKGISGLGNRIFVVLTGILYAQLTGRKLVVDWSDPVYSDDGSDVFHRFFVCPSAGRIDDLPETDSVVPSVWRGRLGDPIRGIQSEYNRRLSFRAHRRLAQARLVGGSSARERFQRRASIDVTNLGYEAEVAVMWNWSAKVDHMRPHLRGEFAGLGQLRSAEILASLLTQNLFSQPGIQARVDEFKSAHFDGPMVGVHLRMSDRRVRVQAILAELDLLLQREPDLRVFAATDSIEAKEILERRYPGVLMTPHWYPPAGMSQHNSPECPDRVENGVEALVDLSLLASCDYLVGDRSSSFTRLAGLLASARDGHVVDVRPPPRSLILLKQEVWRRHAAMDSAVSSIVRTCARARRPVASLRSRPRSRPPVLREPRRSPEQ